jgi:hypothetical protein
MRRIIRFWIKLRKDLKGNMKDLKRRRKKFLKNITVGLINF